MSQYLMLRTTKIGKTQINMSIKTGDRIFVGKKTTSIKVTLANPTTDDLKDLELDDEMKAEALKVQEELKQKAIEEYEAK